MTEGDALDALEDAMSVTFNRYEDVHWPALDDMARTMVDRLRDHPDLAHALGIGADTEHWVYQTMRLLERQRDAVLGLVHSDQPYIRRGQLLDALGVEQ